MANNKMFIRCKSCGRRLTFAKYYPSTGWYPHNPGLMAMKKFFDTHDDCADVARSAPHEFAGHTVETRYSHEGEEWFALETECNLPEGAPLLGGETIDFQFDVNGNGAEP